MAQSIQVKKVGWWHERLADLLIAHPHLLLGDIAKMLNVTPVWLSIVKNSDVFQDYWRERSRAHSDAVTQDIKAKAFSVVDFALTELNDRLAEPAKRMVMPVEQLLDITDITMKRFNYGADKAAPQTQVNLVFPGLVNPEQLQEARARMREQEAKVIELHPEKKEDQASGEGK